MKRRYKSRRRKRGGRRKSLPRYIDSRGGVRL